MDEFPCSGRARRCAWWALEPDFVVNKNTPRARALARLDQQRRWPPAVCSNHDLGDKPDAHPSSHGRGLGHTTGVLARLGTDYHDLHLVGQILNTGLPAEEEQRLVGSTWLRTPRRASVFLHLPPYLHNPAEPHLGHYDNIGEPARTWLLELLAAHQVDWLFAAHVHFAFCEPAGAMYYRTVPSTSFARPGLSHLFSSAPPPEQGRNDQPKLGFFLCRLRHNRLDIHLIRTAGAQDWSPGPRRLLTPATADLGGCPIGTNRNPSTRLGNRSPHDLSLGSAPARAQRLSPAGLSGARRTGPALSLDRLGFVRRPSALFAPPRRPSAGDHARRREYPLRVHFGKSPRPSRYLGNPDAGRALAIVVVSISIQELPP